MQKQLKQLLSNLALSQKDFSEKLSVSAGNVGDWLRGRSEPTTKALRKISESFSVNTNWLLTGEGEMFLSDDFAEGMDLIEVPFYGDVGASPLGTWEADTSGETISVSRNLINTNKKVFALRAVGPSMVGAGILDKSYVILEEFFGSREDWFNRDIGVIYIDGEQTIKRISFIDDFLLLRSDSFPPQEMKIYLKEVQEIKIQGKFLAAITIGSKRL